MFISPLIAYVNLMNHVCWESKMHGKRRKLLVQLLPKLFHIVTVTKADEIKRKTLRTALASLKFW